jgi:DNA (cytosine-5)-methyltransferase 1
VPESAIETIRNLTRRERARIQTFPENFAFENIGISNGHIEQMIGNAVPVMLATFLAQRLHDYIGGIHLERDSQFVRWLKGERNYSDRTISDVFSRLHRAQELLPDRVFDRYFITDLGDVPEFAELATDVKSQIRRAIRLWLAFENGIRGDA